MNSDTSTRYGSRVLLHGRSRAARAHQARSLRVNLVLTLALTSDFCLTLRIGPHPFDPLSAISSLPPDLLSHFCPHPLSPSPPCGEGEPKVSFSSPPSPFAGGGAGGEDHDAEGGVEAG